MRNSSQTRIGKVGEHLICANLLNQGYDAFLSDQGLPYDVVVDLGDDLKRVQVKTTSKAKSPGKYRFHLGRLGSSRGSRGPYEADLFAFVVTSTGAITFRTAESLLMTNGQLPDDFIIPESHFNPLLEAVL